ncbi:hypothetical protein FEM48_Zijuj02G0017900 [Ziziphus jujuba var. spinosa]|uniref:Uncharacterized protein n=1 Tax=Ziziphus jujuba var. spinosa TaxID=714518 RepID=A0A978VSW9_ZIZJJ|nr:hypothetical protein FEM48_Zijuj02G0017900 [Ziziphus jujuba var. spinosa]
MVSGPAFMATQKYALIVVSPFTSNVMKLEEDNFVLWRSQILPTLKGHDLEKFILIPRTSSGKVSVLADDRFGGVADVDKELDYWVKRGSIAIRMDSSYNFMRSSTSSDSISLTEVQSRLLAYESKLEDYNFVLSMNLGHSHSANMISSVSHTGLNSINLVQPPTHGHVETSGSNFQFSGPNINAGCGFSPRAQYAQPFQQSVPQPSFTVGGANPRTFFVGVPHTLPHTLQFGFSDNFLYNYNMRSPVMPESTTGIVAPNLQSYGSMSGLSNPFSYGVSTPLGSSNNISGQVPQQSTGFCVHNGVTHFGAPLSASVGMNSAGYSLCLTSNMSNLSLSPHSSANVVSTTVDPNLSWFLDSEATNHVAADDYDKGHYFSNCAIDSGSDRDKGHF